jgi:hypothetical protein
MRSAKRWSTRSSANGLPTKLSPDKPRRAPNWPPISGPRAPGLRRSLTSLTPLWPIVAAALAAAALAGDVAPAPRDLPKMDRTEALQGEIAALELALAQCQSDAAALKDHVTDARIAVEAAVVGVLESFAAPLIARAAALKAELAPLVAAVNELIVADIRQDLGLVPQFFGSGSKTMHDARSGSFKSLLDAALKVGHLAPLPHDGGRWQRARQMLLQDPHADIAGILAVQPCLP